MSEKRKHDDETEAMTVDEAPVPPRPRVRAIRTAQLHDVYAVEEKALEKILGAKLWRKCRIITSVAKDRTVHAVHPEIVRYPATVKFNLNPRRDDAYDLQTPIENLLPRDLLEIRNGVPIPDPESLLPSVFLLHGLVVKRHRNPAPFTVALSSNIIDHLRKYFMAAGNGQAWHEILTRTEPLEMPETSGEWAFYTAAHGDEERNTRVFNIGHHLDPNKARVLASLSPQSADNGVFFTTWTNPYTKAKEEVALLASSHIIGVTARADWQQHELRFRAVLGQSGIAKDQRFLFAIPRPTYELLRNKLAAYSFASVPTCDASKSFFQLSRQYSELDQHWTYERQLVAGTTAEDMGRDYEIEFDLELHYSLFVKDVGKRVVNVPHVELSFAEIENDKEIRALEEEEKKMEEDLAVVADGLGIL